MRRKNKLIKIVTGAILVLTTNSLPSYALNEYSIAELSKDSETQTSQITNENTKPLIDKKTSPKPQQNTTGKLQKDLQLITKPDKPPQPQIDDCEKLIWDPIKKKLVRVNVCQ